MSSAAASPQAARLPEDVVKLRDAVKQFEAVAKNMKRHRKEYDQLFQAADGLQRAVCSSCTRKAIVELPLFAQPVVDIATKVVKHCAADMEDMEKNGSWFTKRYQLSKMRGDCKDAIEAFESILQIEGGRCSLIEKDGDIRFPRPAGRDEDSSELGKRISSWDTARDGIKLLLAGVVNAADGTTEAPVKAVGQTLLQICNHVENYHASNDSVKELQTTIQSYWDVLLKHWRPRMGAGDALDKQAQDFLRVLLRALLRLYLLRATPWLKRFIAVATANGIIANERRALHESKDTIKLALGFSTNAGVRENNLEILRGHDKVDGVSKLVHQFADSFQKANDSDDFEKWLAIGRDIDGRQRELQAMATITPDWFFDDKFAEWKNAEKGSRAGLYWISSDPGSGKSVLLSAIIQHVPPVQRVFFHFDMRNGQPTIRDFLTAVVCQLAQRLGGYPPALISARKKGYEKTASEEVLRDAATAMLAAAPRILAIDALDECPKLAERWKAVQSLLNALRGTGARIIVTSRRENSDLVQYMEEHAAHRLHLNDSSHHHELLRQYINLRLAEFDWSVERKDNVGRILEAKAEGMFLWASLHLDRLRQAIPHNVEKMLDEIPQTLYHTYWTIIEGFSTSETVINSVSHVLQCLAVSMNSLSPRQVAELLVAFEFPCLDDVPRTDPPHQRLLLPHVSEDIPGHEAFVLSHLPALLRITKDESGKKVVRFIHLSVVEFLRSAACRFSPSLVRFYAFDTGTAHMTWLRVCLTVLEYNLPLDLTAYAKLRWVCHVNELIDSNGKDVLAEYLTPAPATLKKQFAFRAEGYYSDFEAACVWGQLPLVSWFLTHGVDVTNSRGNPDNTRLTPLHLAAANGHMDVVELLLAQHPQAVGSTDEDGNTPLHYATDRGHFDVCSLLLDKGCDILHSNSDGRTALHVAADLGHLGVAQLLIQRGAYVEAQSKLLYTPLHYAAFKGHTEAVKLLINHGASLTLVDEVGWTALFFAEGGGHFDVCSLLLDVGCDILHSDFEGRTALHLAATSGHLGVARLLIQRGAHVDAPNKLLRTSLHLAAWNGHTEAVELLIHHGASLTLVDEVGWTALFFAAHGGHFDVCSLLLDVGCDILHSDSDGNTVLHLAATLGHLKVARLLIQRGAHVDAPNKLLRTSLHPAAWNGHTEAVELLIHHGASLTLVDEVGWTALFFAAHGGHFDVCSLLLDKGSDILHSDFEGRTPLHLAANSGHLEVARLLIQRGAHVDAPNKHLHTPLHPAAWNGHTEAVELLIHHGASLTLVDEVGWTALFFAADGGHFNVCSLLLDKGSDILHSDFEGRTPLHLAANSGHLKVARLLIQRGAYVDAPNKHLHTPLHCAAWNGHTEVVKLLIHQGASLTLVDEDGWTAPLFAADGGHSGVCSLLSDKGCDILHSDFEGRTALHLAAYRGHFDVARWLLLRHGASPTVRNNNGDTPRDIAQKKGHEAFVAMLSSWEALKAGDSSGNPAIIDVVAEAN